jgi:hypothetical protein
MQHATIFLGPDEIAGDVSELLAEIDRLRVARKK